ncbi:MAG: DoxX family protein [Solirubrobacterales bacterium]
MIWIAQATLAAVFATAGLTKHARSKAELLTQASMGWVEDFDARQIKSIGTLEIAAAVGLIIPAAVEIVPVLMALAASGVFLLATLALFVAIERFGPHSL